MVPEVANGPYLDLHFDKAHSETVEYDKFYKWGKQPGIFRFFVYNTFAHMGNYKEATGDTQFHNNIALTRQYGRTKTGFAINMEQALNDESGLFMRLSWNDGTNETWAFTEIDQSASLGYSLGGKRWKRPDDRIGVAVVVNGLSPDHRNYLAAGGSGFILGDGALNYGLESIAEVYYSFHYNKYFFISPDYQFIMNPGYNKDRGPINVFGVRAHVEF
jgi:high affinity Mn2+ porin